MKSNFSRVGLQGHMVHHPPGGASGAEFECHAMTRCECADLSFAEIARRVLDDGASFDELRARTGCGETCTACLPDLQLYLDIRR